jgi:hypothetical protein
MTKARKSLAFSPISIPTQPVNHPLLRECKIVFPQNTWVFDLEIIKAIPDKKGMPIPGIAYCGGWTDFIGMGISVLAAANIETKEVRVFVDTIALPLNPTYEPISNFGDIIRDAAMLIGHNSRSFDANVLKAKGFNIPPQRHYDFYHEVKRAMNTHFPRGWNLNDLSKRCGGPGKSGDGGLAPIDWQRGKYQQVIDYCVNDTVGMTLPIALHFAANEGTLPTPTMSKLPLRHPAVILGSQEG